MTDSDRRPRGLIGLLLVPIVGAVLALAAYLGRRLAAHARRAVEVRYDWRAIGQQFVDLVEGVAKREH